LEEGVIFDDILRDEANKESRFKTSDLKYYLLTFAFIGLGTIIILKYSK
jgi:hypothetical protein